MENTVITVKIYVIIKMCLSENQIDDREYINTLLTIGKHMFFLIVTWYTILMGKARTYGYLRGGILMRKRKLSLELLRLLEEIKKIEVRR